MFGRSRYSTSALPPSSSYAENGNVAGATSPPARAPEAAFALRLRVASYVCAGSAAVICALTLLGWALHSQPLERLAVGLPPMTPSASLALLLASLSSVACVRSARATGQRAAAMAGAAIVVLIGAATLAEYVFGVRLGIDQLLLHDRTGRYPGRPGVNTALMLVALGGALLCAEVRVRGWWAGNVLAWMAATLGLLELLAYSTGAAPTVQSNVPSLAAGAASLLGVVVAAGILLARPDRGAIATMAGDGLRGIVLRRLLPTAIGLPLALATVTLAARRVGLIPEAIQGWVLAGTVTLALVLIAARVASAAQRIERERLEAEAVVGILGALVKSSPSAIIALTPSGTIVDWNAGAEDLYGYSAVQVVGRSITILDPPEQDRNRQHVDAAASGHTSRAETQHVRRDGSRVEVEVTLSPILDSAGNVIGASCTAQDITERKRAEQATGRLAAIVESSDNAIIGKTLGGQITSWNHAAERIYGYSEAEALGKHISILLPHGHHDQISDLLQRVAGGASVSYLETVSQGKDGRLVDVSVAISPIRDASGGIIGASTIATDITEHKQADRARDQALAELRHSEERQRTILEAAPIGVALADAREPFTLLYANSALVEMLGQEAAQLIGRGTLTLIDRSQRAVALERLQRLLDGEDRRVSIELELELPEACSDALWVDLTGSMITGADGRPEHLVFQLQDITERRRFENELRFYAERDGLTGLLNRRRLEEELDRAVAASDRYRAPATLVVCDLDNLKLVNDTLGHKAGDALIKSVAGVLADGVRRSDVVARIGGDEFAVLMPHTGLARARSTAERLRTAALELDLVVSGHKIQTTLSVGIAPIGDGLSAEDSMVAADMAMYEAKRNGRNRVVTSRQAFTDEAMIKHLGWLGRLRTALAEDRFELHAQPIVDLRSGDVRHFELLLRMRERDGELLMPSAFIPTAERFGVIADIDRWVVRKAIQSLAADSDRRTAYAINLSGIAVGDPDLLSLIEREIADSGVDPRRLIFEFTETSAIADLGASREFTHGLARLGCSAALDDFGSGFGSFSYLKHLPVDYLKIDGDFVRNLPGNGDDRILVKAIVDVARGLRKQTIAEFVGSQDAVELLREYGVDYAQGFYLGKPSPLGVATHGSRVA